MMNTSRGARTTVMMMKNLKLLKIWVVQSTKHSAAAYEVEEDGTRDGVLFAVDEDVP